MIIPKIAFKKEVLILPLSKILPIRVLKDPEKELRSYSVIVASIKKVGLVEPLMVYPKGHSDSYFITDGHLRYYALKDLGIEAAECLVAIDNESFTYNARISRVSPIQEHRMIAKAVSDGVSIESIAEALNMQIRDIKDRLNLLNGLHEEAVDLLKDKPVCPGTLRILRKVKSVRQIEMAELMVCSNDYGKGYAEALFFGTSQDQVVSPVKKSNLSSDDVNRLQKEMEALEREFKGIEETYSENMLHLTMVRGYAKRLLENAKVVRFLGSRHQDLLSEFERLTALETV